MENNMMEVAGLRVGLHLTTALVSRQGADGQEVVQGLPPYGPTPVYDLEEYPEAPEAWERGNGRDERTYFFAVPRRQESGVWFDFRSFGEDANDVAVRVSMQGVNAMSGMLSEGVGLHWYKTQCPVHEIPFGSGRVCGQCGFSWPGVNFLSTSGARKDGSTLWLDGFRNAKGEIRQAIFVDDHERGVAAQLIGGARFPAFAFVLYRSKGPKPRPYVHNELWRTHARRGGLYTLGEPEVAAGALVQQRIGEDPNDPAYWQDHPCGILRLYFGWEDEVAKILTSRPSRQGKGFLSNLQTGNPNTGYPNKVY